MEILKPSTKTFEMKENHFKNPTWEAAIKAKKMEKLGTSCMDGGACHHHCETQCFRSVCCVPFSDSGLDDDWQAIATPKDMSLVEKKMLEPLVEKGLHASGKKIQL